jgi:hypothetical protein
MKCDLLANSYDSLNYCESYFSNALRQSYIYIYIYMIAIAGMKKCPSPGREKILAKIIRAGGEIWRSKIHELPNFSWNENEFLDQCKESQRW